MKVYKTQEEILADVKDGWLVVYDNVTFDCDVNLKHISIRARDILARCIRAWDISARDIRAGDIDAWGISARGIDAWDISAGDIHAGDIRSGDISAGDIRAGDIRSGDIDAWDIRSGDISARCISYYAVCYARRSFKCKSIKGERENSRHFCLDQEIEFVED